MKRGDSLPERTCANCLWYAPGAYVVGTCRRWPPKAVDLHLTVWPKVHPEDWCGEHQLIVPEPKPSEPI